MSYIYVAHHLLRVCLGACRGAFLLRLLPFEIGKQLAADLSIAMRRTLASIAGQPIPVSHWERASFFLQCGGAGILDPIAIHPGACISARLKALKRFEFLSAKNVLHETDVLPSMQHATRTVEWIA